MTNSKDITQILSKCMQALHSDLSLYLSNDAVIATTERKNIVLSGIKLLKDNLDALEKSLA